MAVVFDNGISVGDRQVVRFSERAADEPRAIDVNPSVADPARKVADAATALRSGGYGVPKSLELFAANVRSLRSGAVEPQVPSATDPKFDQKLDKYVSDHAAWQARRAAQTRALEVARGQVSTVVREAATEILQDVKLRDDFDRAASDYRAATLKLHGFDTLEQTAAGDMTGELVGVWHARTAAGKKLSDIVDVLKRVFGLLAPLGWSTAGVLAFATDRPSEALANTVRDQIHVPDVCRRWEALVAAGRPTVLVSSLQEYAERLSSVRGVAA